MQEISLISIEISNDAYQRKESYATDRKNVYFVSIYLYFILQWDTAGEEKCGAIQNNRYYEGTHGVIVVIDLTNEVCYTRDNISSSIL